VNLSILPLIYHAGSGKPFRQISVTNKSRSTACKFATYPRLNLPDFAWWGI